MNLIALLFLTTVSSAVAKPHMITFGKWIPVQYFPANDLRSPVAIKVRPLLIDGRVKEFVSGSAHDVTDRLFVVRRAFRLNDSLPEDAAPRWQWQPGAWLLVDRATGHISPINLPDFDPVYSSASWYRDYVAYCGVSEDARTEGKNEGKNEGRNDGKKVYAIVAQISRRKPVLKIDLPASLSEDAVGSACNPPAWQRAPMRVSFDSAGTPKQTFAIRGHVVDLISDGEDTEEGSR